ncbi:MAG: hypothetical protein Q9184_001071 [Pyrenodesmia sp. 2 TL-2023]
MASTNAAPSADTPIAIKLALNNGENKRFKVALRDLGASTLPDKVFHPLHILLVLCSLSLLCLLRSLLAVPPSQSITFERFSDSASSYIPLDSSNPAVYKQLYRAAKAKLKLRIRATVTDAASPETDSATIPNPLPVHCCTPTENTSIPSSDSVTTNQNLLSGLVPSTAGPNVGANSPSCVGQPLARLNLRPKLPYDPCASPSVTATGAASLLDTANPAYDSIPYQVKEDYQMQLMLLEQQNKHRLLMARQEGAYGAAMRAAPEVHGTEAPVPRSFTARDDLIPELASLSMSDSKKSASETKSSTPGGSYSVCCNQCHATINDAFWHCGLCSGDDYDLCQACVKNGWLCEGEDHWLIKRIIKNGEIINSTTETIGPMKIAKAVPAQPLSKARAPEEEKKVVDKPQDLSMYRTCNSCVEVYDDSKFVTCEACEDFDLCIPCFVGSKHGHHPSHAFAPAHPSTQLDSKTTLLCAPGRNLRHYAICDGCDKIIHGIRHKCLNCPDWDFCSTCIKDARVSHPGHRFIQLNEPIPLARQRSPVHYNINCDGPLCKDNNNYIVGDRYKCAVCHDTDFCAKCEAVPTNRHNRTHPLIKFKSPIRHVSVTTLGEKENGEHMCTMGDQLPPQFTSKATETVPVAPSANAATQVQTVAEVKPTEAFEEKPKQEVTSKAALSQALQAHFIRDAVADGTVLPPSAQFGQVWTLRNPGPHAWPAGCSVHFVGGDSMFNVDPNHPSSVNDIKKATASNIVDRIVAVGQEVEFYVTMRAPEREGKAISYWRLKDIEGVPFGHKLWCDIVVARPEVEQTVKDKAGTESQMIFPILDKESPLSSSHVLETHEAAAGAPAVPPAAASVTSAVLANGEKGIVDEVENLSLEDDVSTEDGFLTDEEFELLEASEDDFAEAANGKQKK